MTWTNTTSVTYKWIDGRKHVQMNVCSIQIQPGVKAKLPLIHSNDNTLDDGGKAVCEITEPIEIQLNTNGLLSRYSLNGVKLGWDMDVSTDDLNVVKL